LNWPDDYINKVICGDCLDIMQGIPDGAVDLVVTDPPYGMNIARKGTLNVYSKAGYKASDWDKDIPTNQHFDQLIRVSRNQIIFGGNYFPYLWTVACRGFIYWNKCNHTDNRADGELAWTSFDMCSRHIDYLWDGNRYGFPRGTIRGVGKPTIRSHPTQKPKEVMSFCITIDKSSPSIILDPFCGSGTTLVAAKQLGRKYIGIDISRAYCDIAEDRLRQEELF